MARGNVRVLYALVCALCALLTAAVSLDASVLLMVPLISVLAERFRSPFAPLFLGVVAVGNATSIAVAQGNPTNLVVIAQLGLDPARFTAQMLIPGLVAAGICAGGVALRERHALAARCEAPAAGLPELHPAERHAALAIAGAGAASLLAPFCGVAPWWPFSLAVAAALLLGARASPAAGDPVAPRPPAGRPARRDRVARSQPHGTRRAEPAGPARGGGRRWRRRGAGEQPAGQPLSARAPGCRPLRARGLDRPCRGLRSPLRRAPWPRSSRPIWPDRSSRRCGRGSSPRWHTFATAAATLALWAGL